MSWLQCLLGKRNNQLALWKKDEIFAVQQSSSRTTMTSPQSLEMWLRRTAVVGPNTDLLNDKRCATRRNRCSKRPDKGKHGRHPTILSRWYGFEEYRKSLWVIGWKEHHKMLYDRIDLEKHIYIATRAERIQNSKRWILTAIAEEPQQPLNQRPNFAQAKREYKLLHDEHLARTPEKYRAIPCSSEKDNNLRATKNTTTRLTLKQIGGSTKGSRGKPADSFVRVAKVAPKPLEDEQLEFSALFKPWLVKHFSQSKDSGCLEKNLQTTDGVCEQHTHKYSTCRVAQHDHISSREHAWLKSWKAQDCTSLCLWNNCHPRVMSHSLPHLTLTPSISSLSPISSSIIFPTVSPTHTIYGPRPTFTLRCSTAEWRINTNPISQIQERFMRNNHQQPITKDVDEFGKVGAEMSHLQSMIEVFHSSPNQTNRSKGQESQGNLSRNTTHHIKKKQNPTKHVNLDLNFVDHVSSNVRSSRCGAMLYVFEDNEAVIMIII